MEGEDRRRCSGRKPTLPCHLREFKISSGPKSVSMRQLPTFAFDKPRSETLQCRQPFSSPMTKCSATKCQISNSRSSQTKNDDREKQTKDHDHYRAFLEENKAKCKRYREKGTIEMKEKWRMEARVRMTRKRERDRKSKETLSRRSQSRDEETLAETRARWAEKKRRQRATRSAQKLRRDNEKQRKRRATIRLNKVLKEGDTLQDESLPTDANSQNCRTAAAKRQALKRARISLPVEAEQYADTVEDLINKASPRKKAAMEKKGFLRLANRQEEEVGESVIKTVREMKSKHDLESRRCRTALLGSVDNINTSVRQKSRLFSMSRKTLSSPSVDSKRQERTHEIKKEVGQFFTSTAVPLPDKKTVSKKTGCSSSVLKQRLKDLHGDYQRGGGRAAFSTFAKCRPANVRTMMRSQLRQCLCEYCANVDLKLKAINPICIRHNCHVRHVYHAVQLSTCEGGGKVCAYRQCPNCDISKLEDYLSPIKDHRGEFTWHRWTSKKVNVGGKESSRKVLETRRGCMTTLLQELLQEMAFLSQHLFRAEWQRKQFEGLRTCSPFPENTVCMVMDFSENYTCVFQDEVQSAHWHHDQVTVHPIVTYYGCKTCAKPVCESMVFISNDLGHDHHAVQSFFAHALTHLQDVRSLQLQRVVQWTDGCSSQYKSKGPFADISLSSSDFGLAVERNFYGSRHGKGPSDGESAVVKSHASNAVKAGRATIADAKEFYLYCFNSVLNRQPTGDCHHFLRSFFWMPQDTIDRNRQERAMRTVKGTRDFHQVKSGLGVGTIITRHLSCFCSSCTSGEGDCANLEVVGLLKEHTLVPEAVRRPRAQRAATC